MAGRGLAAIQPPFQYDDEQRGLVGVALPPELLGIDPMTGAPMPSEAAQGKFSRIADALLNGARNWIETPGRAMREGITTEQAADWAAPTAFGMVAGARLPGGAPEGALGSSGAKLAQPEGIRAYHGSPYDFDRFDVSKMGTGAGLDRGHGLYFAENQNVAQHYRDRASTWQSPGKMYEVDLRRRPEEFLDQDRPLDPALYGLIPRTDPKTVKWETFSPEGGGRGHLAWGEGPPDYPRSHAAIYPKDEYGYSVMLNSRHLGNFQKLREARDLTNEALQSFPHSSGQEAYRALTDRLGSPALASEALRAEGVPGMRYLDAGSRSAGDGSRNYVVFDPGIVDILRKYGLAALPSAGAMMAATNQDNQ